VSPNSALEVGHGAVGRKRRSTRIGQVTAVAVATSPTGEEEIGTSRAFGGTGVDASAVASLPGLPVAMR